MPANNSHHLVHYWAGKYGGLGHLYSPGGERGPYRHLPYALDNGAFTCWTNGTEWDEDSFLQLIEWACSTEHAPRWVAAPDVVTDARATLSMWDLWSSRIRSCGLKAALVVQDGMTPSDVKSAEPDVVFIGGSTEWKWLWLWRFCDSHARVHVGRVNGYGPLIKCYRAGAESCDGTGWFRGDKRQIEGLERFLREQTLGLVPEERGLF